MTNPLLRMTGPMLAPLLTAVLLLLAFPPFHLYPLAWVALVPFFSMIEDGKRLKNFLRGFLAGLLFFGGLIWWLNYVTTPGYCLLILYLGLYFGTAALVLGLFKKTLWRALIAIPLWVSLEFFRCSGIFGFTWGCLGHSQYSNLAGIQIADLAGVYGITALMVAFASSLSFFLAQDVQCKQRVRLLGCVLILIVLSHLYGFWRMGTPEKGDTLTAGLLQGNIPQNEKWDPKIEEETIKMYARMSRDALQKGAELVVWPETAIPVVWNNEPELDRQFREICVRESFWLLFGTLHYDYSRQVYHNSACFVTPESIESASTELTRYDKMRLVPFGEYVPFKEWIPFVQEIVESEGGGAFECGRKRTTFHAKGIPFSTLICFESTLAPVARRMVRGGARGLVVLTNDEWFGRTPASIQHGMQSVFRAVENRVPVVRATNTGWTCSIDPKGRTRIQVPRFHKQTLIDAVTFPRKGGSVYTWFGDWFAWLNLVAFATLSLWYRRLRVPRKESVAMK